MKILLRGFILPLISLIIVSSCNTNGDDLPDPIPPVVNDSTLLWKFVKLDTTTAPGLDTIELYLFEYDSQKRITLMSDFRRLSTSPSPAYTSVYRNYYFYDGIDTTPNKVITLFTGPTVTFADTAYYTYSPSGTVASDSFRRQFNSSISPSYQLISATDFSGSGTMVTSNERRTIIFAGSPPVVCTLAKTYNHTYLNGNIIVENDNSSGCSTGSSIKQISLDNKPNPFFTAINIHFPVTGFDYFRSNQKNNVLEEEFAQTYHFQNDYTYGTNGLPSIVRWTDVLGVQRGYRGLFFYRKP